MSIYFHTCIIVIKSIILIVIITIILVNNLISVNYLCLQPLIIALKCLTCLYSIYRYVFVPVNTCVSVCGIYTSVSVSPLQKVLVL